MSTFYEDCHRGPYRPFRSHDTAFGWGICHEPTGRIFALVGSKSECFGVSAALNGHWEAAKAFMEGSADIKDDYFQRFPSCAEYPERKTE